MTDDYNNFTDRFARNCAIRRAEEEEQRRAQQPQQPSSSEALVYKTYSNSPAPQPQQQEDPWAAWNLWADRKIENALYNHTCELVSQINKAHDNLVEAAARELDDLADKTNKLEEALDREREKSSNLAAQLEVMRVLVRAQNIGVTTRSKRDVT